MPFIKGQKVNLGKKFSLKWRRNLSKSHKGQMPKSPFKKGNIPWNKELKGKYPKEYSNKIAGSKNYNWKGGTTPLYKKIRKSIEYKLWRIAVFERDNHTCRFCGQRGGILQADHIKRFADYPELRFAIDNGRTLCIDCHRKTNTWGFKIKLKT